MEWDYWVEEISATASKEEIEKQMFELGSGGWEAVTSWSVPGDPHHNNGAWKTFILFKKAAGR